MDSKKIKNISNSKKISDKDLSILKDLEKKYPGYLLGWYIMQIILENLKMD